MGLNFGNGEPSDKLSRTRTISSCGQQREEAL